MIVAFALFLFILDRFSLFWIIGGSSNSVVDWYFLYIKRWRVSRFLIFKCSLVSCLQVIMSWFLYLWLRKIVMYS